LPVAQWGTATWAVPPDAARVRVRVTIRAAWAARAAVVRGVPGVPETAQATALEPRLEVRTPRPPRVAHRSH